MAAHDGAAIPVHDGQIVETETIKPSDLKRGDVIVFEYDERTWIKRLIGLPSETIEIRDGDVFVNGVALSESYLLVAHFDYGTNLGNTP